MGGAFGGRGGQRGRDRRSGSDNSYLFGGNYVVFVLRGNGPEAIPVRTGLTDLDYSEVLSGLALTDTVLALPSASLLRSQAENRKRPG